MKLFKALFGSRSERLEEKGDDLRLGAYWRESAWFYRQAVEALGDARGPARDRLLAKEADVRRRAFREMMEEAEALIARDQREEALKLLAEAGGFAETREDRGIVLAWRHRLGGAAEGPEDSSSPQSSATTATAEPEASDLDRRFRQGVSGRPEPERKLLAQLGPAGREGFVALCAGDSSAALQALEREVEEHPESAMAHELLARALEAAGRYDEVQAQLESAYRRAPDRWHLPLEMARVLRERLDDAAAGLRRMEAACRRHPASAETLDLHVERAFLLADMARVDEAIEVLDGLLAVPGVDRAFILFNRAGLQEGAGRLSEAEADLVHAVQQAPSNILYLERLADFYYRGGQEFSKALGCLDRALAMDAHDFAARKGGLSTSPDRARLQFKSARILRDLGNWGEARTRVDEALIVCSDQRVEEALLGLRRELLS